ncbi:MAG: isochorismatase family protein [Planctomycetales bacterium]|nr:isochorismatase family protein [Planctomycetales bacterium]NIM09948.1 isochorismatase family protein [Planctomycetales bacterium]NIN09388.1 isochorismatase family protein [Planctomycetales bacterium]NIN78495.1 isochorismatase family protein [Planctomycetales bacterium]NIO35687.1 isochorismatase family protein [Planctomycetales bacterium]
MSNSRWSRSPYAMSTHDTALLVVDVQEKLIGLVGGHQRIVWNLSRLIDAARILDVRVTGSEQYPQGLGPTIRELADRIGDVPAKVSFSCIVCDQLLESLVAEGVSKLLVAGIETHVCVQQTVLDLLASGLAVFVAADATGSRCERDHEIALRRMDSAGATITTTEAAIFEWCQVAGTPQFKQISQLIRQPGPDAS